MDDTTPRLYKVARTDSRLNASTVGGGSSGAGPSFLFAALAVPKLNATRASALLRGNVPCFNPALSTAYGKGVRELESTTEVEAQHEELRPEELCSLLASTGPLCALGVRTLLALAQASTAEGAGDVSLARTALDAALTVGALPLVFNVAANLAAELESETTSTVSSALSLMSAVVDLIATLCSAAVFPSDRSPGISAASQMRRLAAACAAMVRDAAYESMLGTAIADIEVSIAAKLIDAFYFIELHPMTNPDMPDDVYANEFASGTFLAALLQLLTATSCTPRATSFAKVLHYGSNYYEFNISLAFNVPTLTSHSDAIMGAGVSAGGAGAISTTHMFDAVKYVLNALSSTSHDDSTMLELLSCVGNLMIEGGGVSVTPGGSSAVRDPSWLMRLLLDKDALSELQPSILSSNPAVSLDAAYTVMGLASWPDAAEAVNKSGVIALVQDVLRTVPPGSVTFAHTQWGANDVPNLLARLQPDSHSAVHLATLGSLCATLSRERNFTFISGPLISNAVRALAATDDPFVFSSVIFILRALKMPLPTFRAKRVSESLSLGLNPEAWGIDQVVAWAGQFPCVLTTAENRFRPSDPPPLPLYIDLACTVVFSARAWCVARCFSPSRRRTWQIMASSTAYTARASCTQSPTLRPLMHRRLPVDHLHQSRRSRRRHTTCSYLTDARAVQTLRTC